MPIVNCFISSKCREELANTQGLIERWAKQSGVSSEHMTINIMLSELQLGHAYSVMANLLLPSIWSDSKITALQLSLAKVLALTFKLPPEEVFVSTNIVDSGRVVEAGKMVEW